MRQGLLRFRLEAVSAAATAVAATTTVSTAAAVAAAISAAATAGAEATATATAARAESAAAATAAEARSGRSLLRLSFVHAKGSTTEGGTVHSGNCCVGFLGVNVDETESAALNDAHLGRAIGREGIEEILLVRGVGQIAHIERLGVRHFNSEAIRARREIKAAIGFSSDRCGQSFA